MNVYLVSSMLVHNVVINLEGVGCDHAHSAITFFLETHTACRISLCAFVQYFVGGHCRIVDPNRNYE